MARILENPMGRRLIRLSADDVMAVVSQYQQQLYGLEQRDFKSVQNRLQQVEFYLPEER